MPSNRCANHADYASLSPSSITQEMPHPSNRKTGFPKKRPKGWRIVVDR